MSVAPSNHTPAGVAVHVEDLTVRYGERTVLWDVDLDLPTGVLGAIVGPNGAGKSTLLKAVVGLVRPAAGHVRVFGEPFARVRKRVAYVPQRAAVDWDFPTTVLDVATMGRYARLGWLRRPGRADREAARAALEQVGLVDLAHRQIGELSGGQQQRAFLARALAQEAELVLMDEPMAGVDAPTEAAVLEVLDELRRAGRTVLVVHHDLQTVADRFEWVALVQVRMIAAGPTAEALEPEALRRAYGGPVAVVAAGGAALATERAGVAAGAPERP
jgi:manganese/zinc/iron transport system ATP- binding protein